MPPAIKVINDLTLYQCSQLTTVIIGKWVKEIGKFAVLECRTLQRIVIPPAVEVINEGAFKQCSQLTSVILGERLEMVRNDASSQSESLHDVIIPPAVKVIKEKAFDCCTQMMTVMLCGGLQKIGRYAFWGCTSPWDRHPFRCHGDNGSGVLFLLTVVFCYSW